MKISQKAMACNLSPMRKFHPYAVAAEKQGKKIYHLNIGQPDIATPPAYFDAVKNFELPVLEYAASPGMPILIKAVQKYYEDLGIHYEESDILITTGGQQSISLFTQVMLNPGDVVVSEDPSFIGALNGFRSMNAKLMSVPMDDEGMRMDKLEELLQTTPNVKFIYVIPTFQNPTGRTMSLERRKELLAMAKKYDVLIVEDNPYFELRYEGEFVPTIKSMDTEGRVIYCGSYSKVLSPGMRLGYCIAAKEIINRMVVCKQVSDVHTNLYFQMLVAHYLEECDLDAHIAEICDNNRVKRDAMIAACEKYFDPRVTFTRPNGGLFIWAELPEGYDSFKLCKMISAKKVACVPGNAFLSDDEGISNGFRMNFSLPSVEQIETAIQRVGETITEFFAAEG